MGGEMPLEVILIRERPPAYRTSMSYPHMSVFVMITVLSDRIESFVALVTTMPELI